MGYYRVYFTNETDLNNYGEYQDGIKGINEAKSHTPEARTRNAKEEKRRDFATEPSTIKNGKKTVTFDKEEIDYTIARYKDEPSLLMDMIENVDTIKLRDVRKNRLMIVIKDKHENGKKDKNGNKLYDYYKELDVVYNNKLLYYFAKDKILTKKRDKIIEEKKKLNKEENKKIKQLNQEIENIKEKDKSKLNQLNQEIENIREVNESIENKLNNELENVKRNIRENEPYKIDELREYYKKIQKYIIEDPNVRESIASYLKKFKYNKETKAVEFDKKFYSDLINAMNNFASDYETNKEYEDNNYPGNEAVLKAYKESKEKLDSILYKSINDYENIRKIIIWEKEYLKQKDKPKEKPKNSKTKVNKKYEMDGQLNFTDYAIQVATEKTTLSKNTEPTFEELVIEHKIKQIENYADTYGGPGIITHFSPDELLLMPEKFLNDYNISVSTLKEMKEQEEKYNNEDGDEVKMTNITNSTRVKLNKDLKIIKEYRDRQDEIYGFYDTGGTQAVIENVSLDKILSTPTAVLEDVGIDLEELGLFKYKDFSGNGKHK